MATDNFLTTKSVLGLAERVVNCPPPEILDLTKYEHQITYKKKVVEIMLGNMLENLL